MATWLDRIANIFRLSKSGVVVLVDHAWDPRLPELLRALKTSELPPLCTRFEDLWDVPLGGTVVFAPAVSQAGAMNAGRPRIATRRLRIVLWCSRTITEGLARDAPDFFDWISHRVDCPAGLAPHVVASIDAAERAGVSGVVCSGLEPLGDDAVEALERDGWTVDTGDVVDDWQFADAGDVVDDSPLADARKPTRSRLWIEGNPDDPSLVDLRVAVAAAGETGLLVVNSSTSRSPGWWNIDAASLTLASARQKLGAGEEWADNRVALLGGELAAIDLVHQLRAAGVHVGDIHRAIADRVDAGAALAELALARGTASIEAVSRRVASAPMLRGLGRHAQVARTTRRLARTIGLALAEGSAVSAEDLGWYVALRRKDQRVPPDAYQSPAVEGAAFLLEAFFREHGTRTAPPIRLILGALAAMTGPLRGELMERWQGQLSGAHPWSVLALEARGLEDAEAYAPALEAYNWICLAGEHDAPAATMAAALTGRARMYRRLGRYIDAIQASSPPPTRDDLDSRNTPDEAFLVAEQARIYLQLWWLGHAWEAIVRLSHLGRPGSRARRAALGEQSQPRAAYYLALGRPRQAASALSRVHPARRDAGWWLLRAEVSLQLEQRDDAMAAGQRGVASTPEGTLARADAELVRAWVLVERGDPLAGQQDAKTALAAYQRRLGAESHFEGRARRVLGECLVRSGNPERALAELIVAERCLRRALAPGHPELLECVLAVSSLPGQRASSDPEMALGALRVALGGHHPTVVRWEARLRTAARAAGRPATVRLQTVAGC